MDEDEDGGEGVPVPESWTEESARAFVRGVVLRTTAQRRRRSGQAAGEELGDEFDYDQ